MLPIIEPRAAISSRLSLLRILAFRPPTMIAVCLLGSLSPRRISRAVRRLTHSPSPLQSLRPLSHLAQFPPPMLGRYDRWDFPLLSLYQDPASFSNSSSVFFSVLLSHINADGGNVVVAALSFKTESSLPIVLLTTHVEDIALPSGFGGRR